MRRILLVPLLLALAACRKEAPTEGAVRLTVSYQGFLPKCVRVSARDAAGAGAEVAPTQLPGKPGGSLTVAVFRDKSWGRSIEVTAAAFERDNCAGAPAVSQSKVLTVADGEVLEESLALVGQDTDADGFLATASGGSDCDDGVPEVRPGAQEVCNERDDNCDGQKDEGFTVGQVCDGSNGCQGAWACTAAGGRECKVSPNQWYPDTDGDLKGASSATPVDSCTQPAGHVPNKDDCDDSNPLRYVGAPELCNATDEDCDPNNDPVNGLRLGEACTTDVCPGKRVCAANGGVVCDAQPPIQRYVDNDYDTHGAGNTALVKLCVLPDGGYPDAGYAPLSDDCDDSDPLTHPGAVERCSSKDEDCDGDPFNGFTVDAGCTPASPGCTGRTVCNAEGTATVCEPLTFATTWYPDEDLDTYGKADGGVPFCSPPDAGDGYILDAGDCDDGNPYTYPGARELCDLADNDCDGTNDNGANVCPASPAWTSYSVGTNSNDWYSASLYGDGGVWVVGTSSSRALKTPADTTFALQSTGCTAASTWNASWADPVSGLLYLGGYGGVLATQDPSGTTCTATPTGTHEDSQGLLGFRSAEGTVSLYGVSANTGRTAGFTFPWDGGTTTAPTPSGVPVPLYDVHGLSPDLLFAVGGPDTAANIYRYNPFDNTWNAESIPSHTKPLRGIWVVHSKLAFAVGENVVLRWDGAGWTSMTLPDANKKLSGVVAFGPSSIYVTADAGKVHRFNGTSWTTYSTVNKPLWDIAGTSPEDLWVVGDDGTIHHWPK